MLFIICDVAKKKEKKNLEIKKEFSSYSVIKLEHLMDVLGIARAHSRHAINIRIFNLYKFLIVTGTVPTSFNLNSILLSVLL